MTNRVKIFKLMFADHQLYRKANSKNQDADAKLRSLKTLLMASDCLRPDNVHFQATLSFKETDTYSEAVLSSKVKSKFLLLSELM